MEINILKLVISLGMPGLILGVFYMLFRMFNFKFPIVPKAWVGPIIVIFMLIVGLITFYALTLWAPQVNADIQSPKNNSNLTNIDMEKSANAGDPVQQYLLGLSYENGLNGYEKDIQSAIFWYSQAATKGHQPSLDKLDFLKKFDPS